MRNWYAYEYGDEMVSTKPMQVKVKKLVPEAVVPSYANKSDAGLDLTATSIDTTTEYIEYGTGLSFEIPDGYVGLIYPRSSISKKDLTLSNSVGVIDSGYRGEVKFRFKRVGFANNIYNVGDRIGQIVIMPYPKIELVEATDLSDTSRGTGGFGSSGT